MALREFVTRLDHLRRMAAVAPTKEEAGGADLWFSPILGKHFAAKDFDGMDPATLTELQSAVAEFDRLAAGPSAADRGRGLELLARIGAIVDDRLIRGGPEEEERKILGVLNDLRAKYRDDLVPLDYELRTDSNGDPGVWVWARVDEDQNISAPEFRTKIDGYRRDVLYSFRRHGIEAWPYVGIRTPTEQKRLLGGTPR